MPAAVPEAAKAKGITQTAWEDMTGGQKFQVVGGAIMAHQMMKD
jgi:hypothetical protein